MQATIARPMPEVVYISEAVTKVNVPSESSDETYLVQLYADGSMFCPCKDFGFRSMRNPAHTCKHGVTARATAISTLPTPLRPAPKPSWTASQDAAWDECLGFAGRTCACGAALSADAMLDCCMRCYSPAALGGYDISDFMPLARKAVR